MIIPKIISEEYWNVAHAAHAPSSSLLLVAHDSSDDRTKGTPLKPLLSRSQHRPLLAKSPPKNAPNGQLQAALGSSSHVFDRASNGLQIHTEPHQILQNSSPWCKDQNPFIHSLKITPKRANFCVEFRPKPSLFISNFRPFCNQSVAKTWPPSLLAPYTTSPKPPSAVPLSEMEVTCGGLRRLISLLRSHYRFWLIALQPSISLNVILSISLTPLIYPTIPLRPTSFVLFISFSKFSKNFPFDLPWVKLKNYTLVRLVVLTLNPFVSIRNHSRVVPYKS